MTPTPPYPGYPPPPQTLRPPESRKHVMINQPPPYAHRNGCRCPGVHEAVAGVRVWEALNSPQRKPRYWRAGKDMFGRVRNGTEVYGEHLLRTLTLPKIFR